VKVFWLGCGDVKPNDQANCHQNYTCVEERLPLVHRLVILIERFMQNVQFLVRKLLDIHGSV